MQTRSMVDARFSRADVYVIAFIWTACRTVRLASTPPFTEDVLLEESDARARPQPDCGAVARLRGLKGKRESEKNQQVHPAPLRKHLISFGKKPAYF